MSKKRSFIGSFGFYLILLICIGALYVVVANLSNDEDEYGYTDFVSDLESSNITRMIIVQNKEIPTGEVRLILKDGTSESFYVLDTEEVRDMALLQGLDPVIRDVKGDNTFLTTVLPNLIFLVVMFIMLTMYMNPGARGNAGLVSFGKNHAQLIMPKDGKSVTFKDVAGIIEEKEELTEIVDFLANPKKYIDVGARIPKGVILVGPPGTGKTLLAKAVAGEAGVPFFSISGSDFVEMFVGVGASRVRDMFAEAKKLAPCIVFIDEIDAVARRRSAGMGGGHDEREQTLNQLLVEMDGFSVNEGIIVMAATNRVDILDPAILRPGRFDRKVFVNRPDVKGREDILKVHAKNKPLSDDVSLEDIAKTTAGFSGADLENLLNEAAIVAAKNNEKFIRDADIRKALIKVGIGVEKKSRIVSEKERRITAYHESGHAILFHLLPDVGPVYTVSIIPTGSAGGYTMPLPERDDMYITRGHLIQDIIVSLGGRAAEEIEFSDVTTGASQDIKEATRTARDMIVKYGFSERLGLINYDNSDDEVFIGRDYGHTKAYSDTTANVIDEEVRKIVEECYIKAKEMLTEYKAVLDKSAALLMEKERITRDEFEALFAE